MAINNGNVDIPGIALGMIETRYAGAGGPAGLLTQAVVRARGSSRLEVVETDGDGARPKEVQR